MKTASVALTFQNPECIYVPMKYMHYSKSRSIYSTGLHFALSVLIEHNRLRFFKINGLFPASLEEAYQYDCFVIAVPAFKSYAYSGLKGIKPHLADTYCS